MVESPEGDYIIVEEWEGAIELSKAPEQAEDKPIPYIVNFSSTGMMEIGWSDKMNPPQNLTQIPPALVAVKLDDEVVLDDSRRILQQSETMLSENEKLFKSRDG